MSAWRGDFPGLHGAYLDSAASAHKPQVVLDKLTQLSGSKYATVSRGLYKASQDMTSAYEHARARIASFINVSQDEIVFTRNATESLNLVAQCWGRKNLGPNDRILLTAMEHHANIVPWQILQKEKGFAIDVVPLTAQGDLDIHAMDALITKTTKLFSFTAASNVLGTINAVQGLIERAQAANPNIVTCVDASQAVVHGAIDARVWGCDFLAFTGHKLYGPTGIGILYGHAALLNDMPPYMGGGDMIDTVTFEESTYRSAPHRFEAGTPAFVEAIGLATAIDYIEGIGWDAIHIHEAALKAKLFDALKNVPGVFVVGEPNTRLGIAPFVVDGCHPADIAMILDEMGVAVRVGHMCAMPLLASLGHTSLIRASLGLYSNDSDIARLEEGLSKAQRMLAA